MKTLKSSLYTFFFLIAAFTSLPTIAATIHVEICNQNKFDVYYATRAVAWYAGMSGYTYVPAETCIDKTVYRTGGEEEMNDAYAFFYETKSGAVPLPSKDKTGIDICYDKAGNGFSIRAKQDYNGKSNRVGKCPAGMGKTEASYYAKAYVNEYSSDVYIKINSPIASKRIERIALQQARLIQKQETTNTTKKTVNGQDWILPKNLYQYVIHQMEDEDSEINWKTSTNSTPQRYKRNLSRYFGKKYTVTKREILQYIKNEFDIYAIRVIAGISEQKARQLSKQSAQKILKNVTPAMEGLYRNKKGQQVYFCPYPKDVALVYKSMGKPKAPSFDDPSIQKKIIEEREKTGRIPRAKYALKNISKTNQKKLFNAAMQAGVFTPSALDETIFSMNSRNIIPQRASKYMQGLFFKKHYPHYFDDEGNINYDKFVSNEKNIVMSVIFRKIQPSLYNNKVYTDTLMKYYGIIKVNHHSDRSTYRTNLFNENYGNLNPTQKMRAYMFYYGNDVEKDLGKEGKEIMKNGDRYYDMKSSYQEMKRKLGPSLASRLDDAITARLKPEDAYHYLVVNRDKTYAKKLRPKFLKQYY